MEKAGDGSGFLYQPLTRRERNILAHLANNRSSQEIAGLETLAYSSVKWYIHQIYVKLGVNRRSEAITRARELGLLRPEPEAHANAVMVKNNLPRQLTSFIGREEEIAQLLAFIQELPLVTLTGSGGTGKTRLALQVASSALQAFPDGAWFVDLASISDPGLVPPVTATVLGLRTIPPSAASQALSEFICRKSLLMILDNCEHLVGAVAILINELLSACPHLHILATSREVLGVEGERPFRCPPLCLPDPRSHPTFPELAQSECVRLFAERAQTVSSSFRLTEANAPLVSRVCQQLDGIPLAIELAAARVRLLSMDQIAARLDNVFHLLTGGGRTALPRHQTLKALVDWSYDLLSEKERQLLCRLSVFAGSWTLEAVEAVCACPADRDPLPAEEILDLLGQLVDKSLIQTGSSVAGLNRYRMLEMIRQYAHHRLLEGGGDEALREQHLDYYLALSLQAEPHMRGNSQQEWKERLDVEIDNLRRAMEWSLSGSIEKGLLLAAALGWFWHGTSHRIEGVEWLDRLLAAETASRGDPSVEPERIVARQVARGKALNASYWNKIKMGQSELRLVKESVAIFQAFGDLYPKDLAYSLYLSGVMDFQKSVELFRKVGDQFYLTEVLFHLAATLLRNGDLVQARIYFEERQDLCNVREDLEGKGCGLWELGLLEFLKGNVAQAVVFFRTSRALLQASNQEFYAFVIRFQAWIALAQGATNEAIRLSQEELDAAQEYSISWVIVDALGFLGWEARVSGDTDLAIKPCEEALKFARQVGPGSLYFAYYVLGRVAITRRQYAVAFIYLKELVTHIDAFESPHRAAIESPPVHLGIQVFGILASAQAGNSTFQARRAAILFGAQASMVDCLMNIIPPVERLEYEQAVAMVRTALGEAAFAAAWEIGQAMTLEQAVAYALEGEE